jgi:hypothetical protein
VFYCLLLPLFLGCNLAYLLSVDNLSKERKKERTKERKKERKKEGKKERIQKEKERER